MNDPGGPVPEEKKNPKMLAAVQQYGQKLFGFIRKKVSTNEDAEDILQDVWFRFAQALDKGPIEEISGWLFAVARNRITDGYRKATPLLLEDFGNEDGEAVNFREILFMDQKDPESEYLKNIFWDALFDALDEIPENQRSVFVQNELEDKTLQQIANETSENLKTIISRKHYAVLHLRKSLQYLYNDLINF